MAKVTKHCVVCDSEDVWLDANAEWDIEAQTWVLKNTLDTAYCDNCEAERSIDDKPLMEETINA